jgi:hypothetical protein
MATAMAIRMTTRVSHRNPICTPGFRGCMVRLNLTAHGADPCMLRIPPLPSPCPTRNRSVTASGATRLSLADVVAHLIERTALDPVGRDKSGPLRACRYLPPVSAPTHPALRVVPRVVNYVPRYPSAYELGSVVLLNELAQKSCGLVATFWKTSK